MALLPRNKNPATDLRLGAWLFDSADSFSPASSDTLKSKYVLDNAGEVIVLEIVTLEPADGVEAETEDVEHPEALPNSSPGSFSKSAGELPGEEPIKLNLRKLE